MVLETHLVLDVPVFLLIIILLLTRVIGFLFSFVLLCCFSAVAAARLA
jgi:hypothetical protein